MTTDEAFRRARQMVAQSPTPTTLREQLAILGRRARRRDYGRTTIARTVERETVESPRHFSWQDRADLA